MSGARSWSGSGRVAARRGPPAAARRSAGFR